MRVRVNVWVSIAAAMPHPLLLNVAVAGSLVLYVSIAAAMPHPLLLIRKIVREVLREGFNRRRDASSFATASKMGFVGQLSLGFNRRRDASSFATVCRSLLHPGMQKFQSPPRCLILCYVMAVLVVGYKVVFQSPPRCLILCYGMRLACNTRLS